MIVTDGYGPQLVTLAEWVAEDLKAIGIKVNIEVLEYATFFSERWPSKEYDIGMGLITPVTDPSESLAPYFKSDGFRNWQGVNDPKLDEMLDQQNLILDKNERIKYINEIERYIFENVTNHVNLFAYHLHYFKQPYVRGFDPHSNYGNTHMKNVWLDK
jgi:peptide/nickel transport system substrate-binding protein